MAKNLEPSEIVKLATLAYSIRGNDKTAREDLADDLIGLVNLPQLDAITTSSSYLAGVSGGVFLKKESGFGFCGYRARNFKDDIVVCLRGTASFHDVLTDAYFKTSPSGGGKPVHDGFTRCFKSLVGDLDTFLKQHRPKAAVHCIGHSLGGALATLAADHISRNYSPTRTYLYTLGSPRVGTEFFGESFTSAIKKENIFRLQHTADPVPAVPIWPFIHVPAKHEGILMDRFGFGFQFAAHQSRQYAQSVLNKSWESLRAEAKVIANSDQIERWLESKKPASFTGKAMMMLSEAIYYVLKKIGLSYVVKAGVNTVSTAGYTLLDMLALALSKGVKLAESLSKWVKFLVIKMLQMLGRKVNKGDEQFSKEAITHVLHDMHKRVNSEVSKALKNLENT